MASVVFVRGVNVGGRKKFLPSALARELEALEVVSVGAAGTFVVGSRATAAQVRSAFAERLPFEADLMVCSARDVIVLVDDDPFRRRPASQDAFVSVLARRPRTLPRLPLRVPSAGAWQVEVAEVHGSFALSCRRGTGPRVPYPNEVVERNFGVRATTRGWPTFLKLRELLG